MPALLTKKNTPEWLLDGRVILRLQYGWSVALADLMGLVIEDIVDRRTHQDGFENFIAVKQ